MGSCGELWFRKVRPQVGGIGVGSPESMAILPLQFLAFLPLWLLGLMILCQVESFSKKSLPGNYEEGNRQEEWAKIQTWAGLQLAAKYPSLLSPTKLTSRLWTPSKGSSGSEDTLNIMSDSDGVLSCLGPGHWL